jgi:outer membrane protein OmpA-like peptidoglycan-associated protein
MGGNAMRSVCVKTVWAAVISLGFYGTLAPVRSLANATQDTRSNVQLTSDVVPLDILFGDGKAVLKQGPHNGPVLKNLKQVLEQYPLVHVEIEGNPDPWGTASANQELSRRRAEAMRDALVDLYRIPAGRIQVHAAGESAAAAQKTVSRSERHFPVYLILYRLRPIPAPS